MVQVPVLGWYNPDFNNVPNMREGNSLEEGRAVMVGEGEGKVDGWNDFKCTHWNFLHYK